MLNNYNRCNEKIVFIFEFTYDFSSEDSGGTAGVKSADDNHREVDTMEHEKQIGQARPELQKPGLYDPAYEHDNCGI